MTVTRRDLLKLTGVLSAMSIAPASARMYHTGTHNAAGKHLLIIDPQNDFCDLPKAYLAQDPLHSGARLEPQLPVAGAHADMQRLAQFINRNASHLANITVTLDSHHRVGIERPAFWRQGNGQAVGPFTQILAKDVEQGRFVPRDSKLRKRVIAYLQALEAGGRYTHMVWPAHCEIGTWGHNVHADVRAAYNRWEEQGHGIVNKVFKGQNPMTEHYSAIMAEVPDPSDPATQRNQALLDTLAKADTVFIGGEASSHCVKATTEHIADSLPPKALSKLVLLTDCMSPVTGFEAQHKAFLADMKARGARLTTSTHAL